MGLNPIPESRAVMEERMRLEEGASGVLGTEDEGPADVEGCALAEGRARRKWRDLIWRFSSTFTTHTAAPVQKAIEPEGA